MSAILASAGATATHAAGMALAYATIAAPLYGLLVVDKVGRALIESNTTAKAAVTTGLVLGTVAAVALRNKIRELDPE